MDIENPDIKLGKGVVVFDGEILKTVTSKAEFKTPHIFPVSVICTLTDDDGFRDWIGDYSVPGLLKYLLRFDRIVGFNHISFDFGIMDGALIREYNTGANEVMTNMREVLSGHFDIGDRDPEPGMIEKILRGRNIDLHLDIHEFLNKEGYPWAGRHTGLDAVSTAMVGVGKVCSRFSGGAEAPKAWRTRLCLEVMTYCRYDVLRTAQVYVQLLDGKPLKVIDWPGKGINEFKPIGLKVR